MLKKRRSWLLCVTCGGSRSLYPARPSKAPRAVRLTGPLTTRFLRGSGRCAGRISRPLERAPRPGPILGVRTADLDIKDVLLLSDPDAFFYDAASSTGTRLSSSKLGPIVPKALKPIIVEAWLARAPKRAVAAYPARRPTVDRR